MVSTTTASPLSGNNIRPRNRANSHDNNNGDNDIVPLVEDPAERKKERRKRKEQQQQQQQKASSSSSSGGSVLWTILVIGLLFCLFDVLYIMVYVDRQRYHTTIQPNNPNEKNPDNNQGMTSVQLNQERKQQRQQQQQLVVKDDAVDQKNDIGAVQVQDSASNHKRNNDNNNNDNNNNIDKNDKEPVLELIRQAGAIDSLTPELIQALPTWSQVVELYGGKPKIWGLETCQQFQDHSPRWDHFVSTAGTFNTGTNLMAELLIHNCHMQDRMDHYGQVNRGVRWQVPWGKHTPPGDEEFRQTHKTSHDAKIDANDILPAVTVRDPLVWLHSMCRHEYAADWKHSKDYCPDFTLANQDKLTTKVRYAEFTKRHESILHLWNDFYHEYVKGVNFYRLFVRYEDLVFFPRQVTEAVCTCAGGTMDYVSKGNDPSKFKYIVNSAKKGEGAHGKDRTGYIDAIIKYGTMDRRYHGYDSIEDIETLQYILDNVDHDLMELFGYPLPDPYYFHPEMRPQQS